MNDYLAKTLKYDEGYKNVVYWDTEGYPTIGIGHLIIKKSTRDPVVIYGELDKQTNTNERILSHETIMKLFDNDINKLRREIQNIPKLYSVYKKLGTNRKVAIENMCFQLGAFGVSNFNKMISALDTCNWNEAYKQGLDSKWAKQTPNRANRVMDIIRYGDFRSYKF